MKIASQCISRAALKGLAFLIGASLATVASAAPFYEGKQIAVFVGSDAGSGYDAYARLLTRHMGQHIPGNPNFVLHNMPGAGSMLAAQHIANLAPKDGSAFGMLFPGAIVEPLTGDASKYRYSPTKLEYIGTADSGTRLCFTMANSGVRSIDDVRAKKVLVGATAPGSSTTDYAWFMNALAGTKFEVVAGYKGPADVLMAMERGEAAGVCSLDSATLATLRPDWISSGKINLLVQAGLDVNPKFKAPPLWDYITGDDRKVAELIVSQQVFGRPFVAPPGIPADKLKILRTAFMETLQAPDAVADAKKMKLDLNPKSGEEIAAVVQRMYSSPPELIERVKKALRP